jgi:membrane protein YqaA with SNARE-associated domain
VAHFGEYAALFWASLLAATVLPFQSEVVLFGMLLTHHYSVVLLVLAASLGNILGSVVNYGLGRALAQFEKRPWFPVKRASIERAEAWYHAYGRWSLLLSWVPVIGDPLTIVAGALRESSSVPPPRLDCQGGPLRRRRGDHARVVLILFSSDIILRNEISAGAARSGNTLRERASSLKCDRNLASTPM